MMELIFNEFLNELLNEPLHKVLIPNEFLNEIASSFNLKFRLFFVALSMLVLGVLIRNGSQCALKAGSRDKRQHCSKDF